MAIISINNCNADVAIRCDDHINAPPSNGRFEVEFFNVQSLTVGQTAHQKPKINDAYTLDTQRKKMLCDITIIHSNLLVNISFSAPTSGFLIIT